MISDIFPTMFFFTVCVCARAPSQRRFFFITLITFLLQHAFSQSLLWFCVYCPFSIHNCNLHPAVLVFASVPRSAGSSCVFFMSVVWIWIWWTSTIEIVFKNLWKITDISRLMWVRKSRAAENKKKEKKKKKKKKQTYSERRS